MSPRVSLFVGIGLLAASLVHAAEDHSMHQHSQSESSSQHHAEHGAHQDHQRMQSQGPTESERSHVPPEPPKNPLPNMSEERMIELMAMEDDAAYSMVILDQLESRGADVTAWELDAWYGTDYNKVWFETEGERADSEEEGRVELMWDRIISPWWSFQTGVRQDFGEGPSRTWADFGIQGLAPYFFEIDAALYVGEGGRTATRFSGEYNMLITQRLILQPELELELYGKDDPENGIGSGLSDVEVGLRLRYEIRRELAPYIGVHWERKFGETADLARDEGEDVNDVAFIVGLRAWF